MSRVAVIGSCITRDLWPVDGPGPDHLLYVSRTSLPSLFAPPVAGFRPQPEPPAPLKRHQHRALVADLSKQALAVLAAYRPTHIIVDFIDERFDLLTVAGAVATRSWELEASGYLSQPAFQGARLIPRVTEACERLWRDGLEEFAAFVRATPLRDARLILHAARWAEAWIGGDGRLRPFGAEVEIYAGVPADLAGHNALLARYQDAFRGVFADADCVAARDRVADPSHRWGPSPFHYTPDYYTGVWRQLRALGV